MDCSLPVTATTAHAKTFCHSRMARSEKKPPHHKSHPRGFTFFEIMIVMALMAFLSVAAISRTISAQREFAFLNTFKQAIAEIREPRLYAVTNYAIPNPEYDEATTPDVPETYIPENYAFQITRETDAASDFYTIMIFAEHAKNEAYDKPPTDDCESDDPPCDHDISPVPFKIDATRYKLEAVNIEENLADPENQSAYKDITLGETIYGFYTAPYADFFWESDIAILNDAEPGDTAPTHLALKLSDIRRPELARYIVIFNVSGVVEAFYQSQAEDLQQFINQTQ
jgi:prepilin-type N-terminal cleavage/methylation domain-containing protein